MYYVVSLRMKFRSAGTVDDVQRVFEEVLTASHFSMSDHQKVVVFPAQSTGTRRLQMSEWEVELRFWHQQESSASETATFLTTGQSSMKNLLAAEFAKSWIEMDKGSLTFGDVEQGSTSKGISDWVASPPVVTTKEPSTSAGGVKLSAHPGPSKASSSEASSLGVIIGVVGAAVALLVLLGCLLVLRGRKASASKKDAQKESASHNETEVPPELPENSGAAADLPKESGSSSAMASLHPSCCSAWSTTRHVQLSSLRLAFTAVQSTVCARRDSGEDSAT